MNYTKIITHPGIFHADDATALGLLYFLLGHLPIERRNPTPEEMADPTIIKVDVGGVFDVSLSAYDHHQRGGAGERDTTKGYGIEGQQNPFAAAGLIWNHFPLVGEISSSCIPGAPEARALWHSRVDALLFRGVDAADCGLGTPSQLGNSPSFSQIIHWLNPPPSSNNLERDQQFSIAIAIAHEVVMSVMSDACEWVAARETVLNARTDIATNTGLYRDCTLGFRGNDPITADRVLVLEKYVPWNEHIFSRTDQTHLLYVVFPSERGGYMLQQVPTEPNSFAGRKPLPAGWAGLRGAKLQQVTGVADAIFCHPGRFCAGAESLEGTLQLARRAVET